jgi:hypothetical protein
MSSVFSYRKYFYYTTTTIIAITSNYNSSYQRSKRGQSENHYCITANLLMW